ncbi:MAG: ParM/StbA family protein [Chloroflexi bacterium]|nr:ParM/StbA family protein [Chloroflexota bacterium]
MNTNIGIDLGMGANKLHGPGGGLQLPSHVAVDGNQVITRLAGMKSKRPPLKVETESGKFYVGAGAHEWGRPVESLDYDRLTGSPEIVAIFYGAMTNYIQKHGPINGPVKLIVGMPLEPLSGDVDAARAVAAQVRGWMRGAHSWHANGKPYDLEVGNVKITGQATGALFDYLLDDAGAFIPTRKGHIKKELGIISVGFNTVELLVVQNSAPVQRFTTGKTSGVRRLLELVDGQDLYSLGELDTQLRAGALDVRDALPIWAREVTGQVEKTWGRAWRRFAGIVLVGGGAVLLGKELTAKFEGRAVMPSDPVMAVSRGLYKLSLMQGRRGK